MANHLDLSSIEAEAARAVKQWLSIAEEIEDKEITLEQAARESAAWQIVERLHNQLSQCQPNQTLEQRKPGHSHD